MDQYADMDPYNYYDNYLPEQQVKKLRAYIQKEIGKRGVQRKGRYGTALDELLALRASSTAYINDMTRGVAAAEARSIHERIAEAGARCAEIRKSADFESLLVKACAHEVAWSNWQGDRRMPEMTRIKEEACQKLEGALLGHTGVVVVMGLQEAMMPPKPGQVSLLWEVVQHWGRARINKMPSVVLEYCISQDCTPEDYVETDSLDEGELETLRVLYNDTRGSGGEYDTIAKALQGAKAL